MRLILLPLLAALACPSAASEPAPAPLATPKPAATPAPTQVPTIAERPRLGVQIDESFDDPANGLPVTSVTAGSAAAAMGFQAADRIKSLNGVTVHSVAELQGVITRLKVGDALTAEVVRKGQPVTLKGTLQAGTSDASVREQLAKALKDLEDLRRRTGVTSGREPTLAEMIQQLQMMEEQFPRAAAEFKKIYPNGEFAIAITITSDKSAKNPIDLMKGDPAAVDPEAAPSKDGAILKEGAIPKDGAPVPAPKKK